MRKRIKPKPVDVESHPFRVWKRKRKVAPGPPPPQPLRERMPVKVPPGSTVLSEDGSAFITTTARGTKLAWDICGRCSVHVKACRCSRPTAPRSVTYIWFQNDALQKGEVWDTNHPNYAREFPNYEQGQEPTTRRGKRARRPR